MHRKSHTNTLEHVMLQCLPQWDQSDALHVPSSQDEVYEVQVPKSYLYTLKASAKPLGCISAVSYPYSVRMVKMPLAPFASLRAEQVAFHNLMSFELGEAHIRTDIARFAGMVQSLVPCPCFTTDPGVSYSFITTKGLTYEHI